MPVVRPTESERNSNFNVLWVKYDIMTKLNDSRYLRCAAEYAACARVIKPNITENFPNFAIKTICESIRINSHVKHAKNLKRCSSHCPSPSPWLVGWFLVHPLL